MSIRPSSNPSAPVFRVDKFVVPADALPAFIEQVRRTQQALGVLPGCRQNLVLTQTGGPGEFNVVTLVEWANTQAIAAATAAMQQKYAEEGFDPSAFMRGLGVRADLGLYNHA
ncbi:antibiotic biosynthesis monooxygenase [Curvibacter delicatus]|uniref:antibiotic biosynthesis monooxygenase n=1 Tax=Curvibacter delicatus TaxID=80879 RepID=UPI00082D0E76|nr:antibiotic biosynthesis monooxygenase [Curvibacter delicatus]